jgi:soluble lytic murein transglycosylase
VTALALAGLTGLGPATEAVSATAVPTPRPRPTAAGARPVPIAAATRAVAPAKAAVPIALASASSTPVIPSVDTAGVKEAVTAARQGKSTRATELQRSLGDPVARKLVEWAILRSDDNGADFARYNAFIAANPRPASTSCGAAPKRCSGRKSPTPPPCADFSPSGSR